MFDKKEYQKTPEYKEKKKLWDKNYYKKNKQKWIDYYWKNREHINKMRQERRKLPEIKEKRREYSKEYGQRPEVRERVKLQGRKYRWENLDEYNKKYRAYYHKTKKNKIFQLRKGLWDKRARKKFIIEQFTLKEWKEKVEQTKGICPLCKKYVGTENLTLDHIYPTSKAHQDYLKTGEKRIYTINDIQPICKSCNPTKSNKLLEEAIIIIQEKANYKTIGTSEKK